MKKRMLVCLFTLVVALFGTAVHAVEITPPPKTETESSALINLQLENISQKQGREESQKLLLAALHILSAEQLPATTGSTVATVEIAPAVQGGMNFTPGALLAFVVMSVLLLVAFYVLALSRTGRKRKAVLLGQSKKRFSLD